MERTVISREERIKRAEEVYNRRRQGYNRNGIYRDKYINDRKENKLNIKERLTRRLLYQLFVSALIYFAIYTILNSQYFFSEDVHNRINEILSYDIQFANIYENIKSYINNENIEVNDDVEKENTKEETTVPPAEINEAEVVSSVIDTNNEEKSQEDIDIDFIKENYNIIWPLNGVVTSRYGTREANDIVSAYHHGLDIAGDTGSDIFAAMDGVVSVSSSEGDYGKHIQIDEGEVSNLYAHCSKLLVDVGDSVKQGDKIAEVGSTGKATGPHLHFEIKRQGRTVDPEKIL